jgi:hypothetical protein
VVKEAHAMTGQLLLAGLLCALALNAITAWIRLARAPREARRSRRAITMGVLSASLQTLTLPLVFVIVLLEPNAFNRLLERAPYGNLLVALGLCLLVLLLLWRLFVELTYTLPVLRREHAEAALGRRVLSIARRQRLLPSSIAPHAPAPSPRPGRVLGVSDEVSGLLREEPVEPTDEPTHE